MSYISVATIVPLQWLVVAISQFVQSLTTPPPPIMTDEELEELDKRGGIW
jgi:hypothetical protein